MDQPPASSAKQVEHIARTAYGRLLAILAKESGDIAAAEDALAGAFVKALTHWQERGLPDKPEAWLLTVARNHTRDRLRSSAHKTSLAGDTLDQMERRSDAAIAQTMDDLDANSFPDERLTLMFVCAHEAIDPAIRTPLMLQTVLGLEARTIATAFAIPAATMAQRLVRAKAKIKQAAIPFTLPGTEVLDDRIDSVLEAIYGAFAADWQGADHTPNTLSEEALFLADLTVSLLPDNAECSGLAALLWFSHARQSARYTSAGMFIPLHEQDTELWDQAAMQRAYGLLGKAKSLNKLGRFQLEAAISCAHAARATSGTTDWPAIVHLYEGLMQLAPTLGSAVARASAVGQAYGPQAGLTALDTIDTDSCESFQPAWVTRAHLLDQLGDTKNARKAYKRAIDLTTDCRIRHYLTLRM